MFRRRPWLRIVLLLVLLAGLFAVGTYAGRWILARWRVPAATRAVTGGTPTVRRTVAATPVPTFTPTSLPKANPTSTRPAPTPTAVPTASPTPQAEMAPILTTPTAVPLPVSTIGPTPSAATVSPATAASTPAVLAAPVLLAPANGATVAQGNQRVTLRWSWPGTLAEDQWFDVNFRRHDGALDFRHAKDPIVELDGPPLGFGHYEWWVRIGVFKGDPRSGGSFVEHVGQESAHWEFTWDVRVQATQAPGATPTAEPPPPP